MTQSQLLLKIAMLTGLGQKVYVPTDFHSRAVIIKKMLGCDSSGIINTLGNFQIDCALVDIKIDTGSDTLNETLNDDWLIGINKQYRGFGIESGIKGLQHEYYRERWMGASFPILKIVDWDYIKGVHLPTGLLFVDGGSVYAQKTKTKKIIEKKQDTKNKKEKLLDYEYWLGNGEDKELINPKKDTHFIYKPYTRWFEKYPSPYLVAKGIYKNGKIIEELKNKELDLLSQVIPYLMHILKGSEGLATAEQPVTYDPKDLDNTFKKFEKLFEKMATGEKLPINVTQFDEQIKQLIPDLEAMFKPVLFENAEKGVLSGFGFIDIIQGIGSNRKEAIINPRAFIREIDSGIKGFKLVMEDLLDLIKEKNPNKEKLIKNIWDVDMGINTEFITDKIADQLKTMRNNGSLSNRTYTNVVSRELTNYDKEIRFLKQEKESEDSKLIVPKLTQVQDLLTMQTIKDMKKVEPVEETNPPKKKVEDPDKLTDDKKGAEARNYNMSTKKLTGSPYINVKELPEAVQKLPIKKQRIFLKIFNATYIFYTNKKLNKRRVEKIAFQTAWEKTQRSKKK